MAKKDNTRELTQAEQQRKEYFEAESERLVAQGYERKDVTFGVVEANVWAIVVTLPLILPFLLAYYVMWGKEWTVLPWWGYFVGLVLLTAFIVGHELIHGAVFACFAKDGFRSVAFGVIWSMLTPYCTCRESLKRKHYMLAILAPTVVLGILPAAVALAVGSKWILYLGVLMILGGGGDIMCAIKLATYRTKGKECLFFDHPYEVGLAVFERAKAE
ncbi:MAG: DUF3267 domain-containing protein [Lachnospiraceae bacterium]|nr:DUF3267 domain-containing protein [Lachnospiraceae bacterium]MBQ8548094.1 DUF3267 domain-containing protein [Lachnospiraceae bacterium]